MKEINILQEMEQVQTELEQEAIVREALMILQADERREEGIAVRMHQKSKRHATLGSRMAHPQFSQVFSDIAIKKICTKYRLRFLPSQLFKGDIPAEAILEVKRIERESGIKFKAFNIIAPAERFALTDSTKDPILMAELPNGKHCYIFQWGEDMPWHRHILSFPHRHIGALALTSSLVGLLAAFFVPSIFESAYAGFIYRFFVFSLTTCLTMTLAIIAAIIYAKDFSENVWNSKYIK